MKRLLLIFVSVMLFSLVGKAQSYPDISGYWSSNKGRSVKIIQKGNKVSWKDADVSFDYEASGSYKPDGTFYVVIERKNKQDACITMMKVTITVISETKIHWLIKGMDNECDLTTAYQDAQTFIKQD